MPHIPAPGHQPSAQERPTAQTDRQRFSQWKAIEAERPGIGRGERQKLYGRCTVHEPDVTRQQGPRIDSRQCQSRQRARHGDAIGDRLFVDVDHGCHDHQRQQHKMTEVLGVQYPLKIIGYQDRVRRVAELYEFVESRAFDLPVIKSGERQSRGHFHQPGPDPKPSPVERRLALHVPPAHQWQAIGPASGRGALRRRRPRADRALIPSQPINAQVEPAGNRGARQKQADQPQRQGNGQNQIHAASLATKN